MSILLSSECIELASMCDAKRILFCRRINLWNGGWDGILFRVCVVDKSLTRVLSIGLMECVRRFS